MKKENFRLCWRRLMATGFMMFSYAVAHAAPPASNKSAPSDTPKSARQPYQSAEQRLWETAVESDKAGAYEAYLRKYPKGRYAALAKTRLDSIETAEQKPNNVVGAPKPTGNAAASPPEATQARSAESGAQKATHPELSAEDELWKGAADSDNASDYEAYLRQYPKGRRAAAAKARLASLRPAQPDATRPSPATQETPLPAQASQAYAGSGNTIRLNDQTMTGNFSVDPATGNVSGTGRIVWNNGNSFEGTMVRGIKEGKGRFAWNNGHSYSGDWVNDMPNGNGVILFANGDRYEGEIRNGQAYGKGMMSFANGDRYEGDVQNGKPHGQGAMRFKSGDSYRGAWGNGMHSGHGRYTWANGSYWEGEFKDGRRTENGQLVQIDTAPATASQPAMNKAASAGPQAATSGR